jgi:peptide-methionine (R)-S-oxide reductase
MADDIRIPTDDELRSRLTPDQYHVTQEKGTEPAFTGVYWDTKDDGVYRCVVCSSPLFSSSTKFDSGTGWPSFWEPITPDAVRTEEDRTFGMTRTEVVCGTCGAHLGHVFPDGPRPTGDRFCMNSCSLELDTDMDPTSDPSSDPEGDAA